MFYILSAGVFCLSLAFFLYRLKREKKLEVDHSHIIFKDYSLKESQYLPMAADAKDSHEQIAIATVRPDTKQPEKPIEAPEEAPLPTLHFED